MKLTTNGCLFCTQGVISDSSDHVYTIMESMAETSKNGGNSSSTQELLGGDEEEERSVASLENQLRKEMTVYEVCEAKLIIMFEWLMVSWYLQLAFIYLINQSK